MDVDRALFLLRYNKTEQLPNDSTEPGKGCTDIRCYKHTHFDEWVYRGSTSKLNPPDEKRSKRRNRYKGGNNTTVLSEISSSTKVPTARKTTTSVKVDSSFRGSVFDDDDYDIKTKKEKAKKVFNFLKFFSIYYNKKF